MMSNGGGGGSGGGGGVRVSIPGHLMKTIQNIKEIAGNFSDEEIYAVLQECSLDPDETAQRLLLQDPFHEVKRKRDRKKENASNRGYGESRWRPGTQGRGNKGGRVNFPPRRTSHDAGGAKSPGSGRDNVRKQIIEKAADPSQLTYQESKNKDSATVSSSAVVLANGPAEVASGSTAVKHASDLPAGASVYKVKQKSLSFDPNKLGSGTSSADANKNLGLPVGSGNTGTPVNPSSVNGSGSVTPGSSSAICFSSSDPVLVPSNASRIPGAVGLTKHGVGSHRTPSEQHGPDSKFPTESLGVEKTQPTESSRPSSSASLRGSSSGSRPSSNYGSRSPQTIGPQKVGSNKEWKRKTTNSNVGQGSATSASEAPVTAKQTGDQLQSESDVLDTEEATSELQKKLKQLNLPRQHVIIPNHILVPESERIKLSFGSFDASCSITSNNMAVEESEKSFTILSENSQSAEETFEEQSASNQNASTTTEEGDYADNSQPPQQLPDNMSSKGDASSSTEPEYNKAKQETVEMPGIHQFSLVHTSPNYSFGFVPPLLGSQLAPFGNSESQARDVSRLPNFVVQQPFDPASFYAHFYRSGTDSDGHVSPYTTAGVTSKYNGNVAVLPSQTSQPQEGDNSIVLSTGGPTPPVTQAAGLMHSSIAVTQQPVPVFRSPAGMHISHYPPNYLPYGHYFSPFYIPPPAIHQFLSNGAFPQQPQASNLYPVPAAAAAAAAAGTGVKYALPQYKPGTNPGNSSHIGMPSGYAPYGSSPSRNSTANEDLNSSQLKDSNVYNAGQQSEGPAFWIAAPGPGRDASSLPAGPYYNVPPQGPHVTFAPTQAAHGAFAGIYHPAQAVTAATVHSLLQQSQPMAGTMEMVGPAARVFQQPQHSQVNGPSSY